MFRRYNRRAEGAYGGVFRIHHAALGLIQVRGALIHLARIVSFTLAAALHIRAIALVLGSVNPHQFPQGTHLRRAAFRIAVGGRIAQGLMLSSGLIQLGTHLFQRAIEGLFAFPVLR